MVVYDKEFLADIYVYAAMKGDVSVGSFEVLCNGESADKQVIKFSKNEDGIASLYMATLQRAFLRAADYVGKYAIPVLDPDKKLLIKKDEKRKDGTKILWARFIFIFHIMDERALSIAKGENVVALSDSEEHWKNLFKMMRMAFAKAKLPYRNLRIGVEYDFRSSNIDNVREMADFADKELEHSYNISNSKNEKRESQT